MEENFKFEIISPEKIVFSGDVIMITLPSYEGDMSILKNHISTINFLRPGIIKVKKNEGNHEVTWNADMYPSGVYFSILTSGGKTYSSKMILLK